MYSLGLGLPEAFLLAISSPLQALPWAQQCPIYLYTVQMVATKDTLAIVYWIHSLSPFLALTTTRNDVVYSCFLGQKPCPSRFLRIPIPRTVFGTEHLGNLC